MNKILLIIPFLLFGFAWNTASAVGEYEATFRVGFVQIGSTTNFNRKSYWYRLDTKTGEVALDIGDSRHEGIHKYFPKIDEGGTEIGRFTILPVSDWDQKLGTKHPGPPKKSTPGDFNQRGPNFYFTDSETGTVYRIYFANVTAKEYLPRLYRLSSFGNCSGTGDGKEDYRCEY